MTAKKTERGDDEEVSPRYKHARKLAKEAREASEALQVVSETTEIVHDSRGKPKKRRVITMSNGNVYRRPFLGE